MEEREKEGAEWRDGWKRQRGKKDSIEKGFQQDKNGFSSEKFVKHHFMRISQEK